jgi:hypothetical protein
MQNTRESFTVTRQVTSVEPCTLNSVRGNWTPAADYWVQVFDAKALPDNGAVPKQSFMVYGKAPFEQSFSEPLQMARGCVVAFSSTEATLTIAAGGGNTGDIVADGEGFATTGVGTEVGGIGAGDEAVEVLEVWTDANGPRKLMRLEIVSTSAADAYAMIFAKDSPEDGDKPLQAILVKAGQTKVCDFSSEGWSPKTTSAAGVVADGCTVAMSSPVAGLDAGDAGAAASLTATDAGEFKIRATWRAVVNQ